MSHLNPSLTALIALQSLDSAIDQAGRRLAELPGVEQALEAQMASATAAVDASKALLTENQTARRQLEKDVAAVDMRMARFEDHKAAVKTNHEYQALNHEIATAKTEKDAIEERILVLMEEADHLAAELRSAEQVLADTTREAKHMRAGLATERAALEAEAARIGAERATHAAGVEARALAIYEQLLKGRRGIAVAAMVGGHCAACHVRLRPHFSQQIRRNDEIIQCESCQRILYYVPPPNPPAEAPAPDGTTTAAGGAES